MLPYDKNSTYGNVTISHRYYHITMIYGMATLQYNTMMTYGNIYDTICHKVVNIVMLQYNINVTI